STVKAAPVERPLSFAVRFGIPWWLLIGLAVSLIGAPMCFRRSRRTHPLNVLRARLIPATGGGVPIELTESPARLRADGTPGAAEGSEVATLRLKDDGNFLRLEADWRSSEPVGVKRGITPITDKPAQLENGDQVSLGPKRFVVEFTPQASWSRTTSLVV